MGKGWHKGYGGKAAESGYKGVKGKGKTGKGKGKPGKGKAERDTTGYHQQGPQRDKSDPNWVPRRGGKKAKKQQELYARKYESWLKELGIPDVGGVDPTPEKVADSRFPNFPGEHERLRELEEPVGVVVEENPSSSSGITKAAGFYTPVPAPPPGPPPKALASIRPPKAGGSASNSLAVDPKVAVPKPSSKVADPRVVGPPPCTVGVDPKAGGSVAGSIAKEPVPKVPPAAKEGAPKVGGPPLRKTLPRGSSRVPEPSVPPKLASGGVPEPLAPPKQGG